MTCTLILMRHAKSSWSNPGEGDHNRPLNKRGERSATALGIWLRDTGHLPDQVMCSSAVRAQQTCTGLGLCLPAPPVPALYLAEPNAMLQVLQSATGQCVLMVGHNPGIAAFGNLLVDTAPDHDRFADFPTGATLVASFDMATWRDLRPGTGHALEFVVPRSLPNV